MGYLPEIHQIYKSFENKLSILASEALTQPRIKWIKQIHTFNTIQVILSLWCGENWIKFIWNNSYTNLENILKATTLKSCVYLMFNLHTKRIIIGSTSRNIYTRFSSHLRGQYDKISRRAANYIVNRGIENWLIIPLETGIVKENLKVQGYWARIFKHLLINNSIKMFSTKPSKKPSDHHRIRNQLRTDLHKKIITNWKRYCLFILNSRDWQNWNTNTLIYLLINLKRAKLSSDIQRKIRNFLRTKRNLRLRPFYELKLSYHPGLDKSIIMRGIKKYITSNYRKSYYQYIAEHIKIKFENPHILFSIISNHRKTIGKFSIEDSNSDFCQCHNQTFSDFPIENGHICCRAIDIPENHKSLKQILTTSSKNPVSFDYKQYLGFQFRKINQFLKDYKINVHFSQTDNENFFNTIKHKVNKSNFLLFSNVKSTLQQYSGMCFVPLDKNSSSWCILCPQLYLELHTEEFGNQNFYEVSNMSKDDIKLSIEYLFKQKVTNNNHFKEPQTFKYLIKRKWELNNVYFLPKNKDLKKTRPIVSYKHFMAHDLRNKIARCLTLMIKEISKHWFTMEMQQIKDFSSRIN